MANETIVNGKVCRFYLSGKIYVSNDGLLAAMPKTKKPLHIGIDSTTGRKYVVHGWSSVGRVYIDRAVIVCFCPPMPKDGNQYMIGYKDGNSLNCHYKNLEWVPYHYQHTTADSIKLRYYKKTIVVRKDGTVKIDNKKADVYYSFYDSDMGLEAVVSPFVHIYRMGSIYPERVHLDDIMVDAGFVQGDNAGLQYPAVLHRDGNWLNFSSDNLEFVEKTDPRYISYLEKRKKDMHEECIKQNPGKDVPDWF